ncbi:TPA: hypothetical protein DCX16_03900 [bacterium]|nr:hypothetical protein [bacterium]
MIKNKEFYELEYLSKESKRSKKQGRHYFKVFGKEIHIILKGIKPKGRESYIFTVRNNQTNRS